MERWQENRRKSLRDGSSSSMEIMRQDSDDDLMYGDTERPPDPMNFLGQNKNSKRKKLEEQ